MTISLRMMKIPFNTDKDGNSRTIKANYWKVSRANFVCGGGTERHSSSRCIVIGQIYKSQQNGMVYDIDGIAPCLCVGNHSGVEPKIMVDE